MLGHMRSGLGGSCGSFFKQFVKFPSIEPNATAGGAIVNFDALFVSHDQSGVGAIGTFHILYLRFKVIAHPGQAHTQSMAAAQPETPKMWRAYYQRLFDFPLDLEV
jgi:hypothetical protein